MKMAKVAKEEKRISIHCRRTPGSQEVRGTHPRVVESRCKTLWQIWLEIMYPLKAGDECIQVLFGDLDSAIEHERQILRSCHQWILGLHGGDFEGNALEGASSMCRT